MKLGFFEIKISRAIIIGACLLAAVPAVMAQENGIAFDSGRWDVSGGRIVDVLGRKAFMGSATLKDVEFENGIIEFDIAATTDRARSYPGVLFRTNPDGSWERFYIRPHRSALYGDVIQYVAAFNGVDSWQLYNGPGATAPAVIPVNQWLHIRIEVSGVQARVFLGNAPLPALVVTDLKHGLRKGGIGIMGPADGTAYFSNFSYRTGEVPAFDAPPPVDLVPGIVRDWRISKVFPVSAVDLETPLNNQKLGGMDWTNVSGGPDGLIDISRYRVRSSVADVVYARTVLRADKDEICKFDIGYSDIVAVFLNGRPVFSGNSQYQGRDSSFLGIVGWFDSVFLPLKKGENELTLAVAEVSGGWGFMVRDGSAVIAEKGVVKIWETPKQLLIPESAACDPVRKAIYVSNFDPFRRGETGGAQFITRLRMDGSIENLRWVGGMRNPTGLFVSGDILYAVEAASLVVIDIPSARIVRRDPVPDAVFLNDIAVSPDGTIYISDSARAAVVRIHEGKAETWIQDPRLARPNGVHIQSSGLLVGTNADGRLKSIDLETKEIRTIASLGSGTIDGIKTDAGGGILVSHNEGRLFRIASDGTITKLLDTTVIGVNIADFDYLPEQNWVVFPTFRDNRVMAYALPPVK